VGGVFGWVGEDRPFFKTGKRSHHPSSFPYEGGPAGIYSL